MYLQPFLLYGSGIIAICLLALLVVVALLYYRINKAFYSLSMEFTLYKKENEQRSTQALQEAQRKAQEIINKTELFSEEMKKDVMNSVEQSLSTGHTTYQKIVSDLGAKSAEELKSETATMTDLYEKELQKESDHFRESLDQGEQQVLSEIKERATTILHDVIFDAVHRTITKEENEKIVLESLEKIKKEYGLH